MANRVFGNTLGHFGAFGTAFFGNDEGQYVESENDDILTEEQLKAKSSVNGLANQIQERQERSIHISMNELVIRARNSIEFLIKKSKVEDRIKSLIEKISQKEEPDLPKKGFVKQAEEMHIEVDSQKAVEEARTRGGEVRERKGR